MKRKQRSGKTIEVSQFWYGPKKKRKGRKKGSSTLKKLDMNMQQTVRCFARVLNCNFSSPDYFVTLTFSDELIPGSPAEALKTVKLFMRRLKHWLSKAGSSIRCAWILSDKTKTGQPERLHVHMVLGGEGVEGRKQEGYTELFVSGQSLRSIWKQGIVHAEHLREQDDYSPVAAYMIVQAVSGEDVKKYHVSQGLEKPVIISEEVIDRPRELRAPAGAVVQEVTEYDVETGTQYMRYIAPEKKPKRHIGFDWARGHSMEEEAVV